MRGNASSSRRLPILALILCAGLQQVFAAEAGEEWLYSFQPGDNLWDLTDRFLIDQSYWNKLVRLNHVKRPRQMPPGTQVRIPLQWLKVEPASVRVVDVRGEVLLVRPGEAGHSLDAQAQLKHGDLLKIGNDASVLLEFADGTRQLLGSNTEVELLRINRFSDTGIGDTTIRVLRGKTENRVPTKGTRFEIRTPSANTAVRGTRFRVKVPEAEQSRSQVEVVAGTVNVTGDAGKLVLAAGFGTVVDKGAAPAPAVRLLPAPSLVAPANTMRRLPLELRWARVPGAKAYRVLVSHPGENSVPVMDVRLTHHRFSTSSLPDGEYRVRVRAIDAAGLDGEESEVGFLLDARPLPPVAVMPPAGGTVRTTAVNFEWSTPPRVSGYHFQLSSDRQFKALAADEKNLGKTRLELPSLQPGTWYWRVASTFGGEQGPWGAVQEFMLKPEPEAPEVGFVADKDKLQLYWQPGRPGQHYRLQIAEDEGFQTILVDEVLSESRWSSPRYPSPVHFRVRVIDDDGYAGAWSPAQTVFPEPEPWYLFGIPAIAIILLAL